MLDRDLRLVIPGTAKPKGSMKCVGRRGGRAHVLVESIDNGDWRDAVTAAARRLITTPAGKGQPVGVDVTTTLTRPKLHYGTGRNAHTLRPTAPDHPVGHNTGDADKLLRLILDALQAADVLPDDSAVVETSSRKAYLTPHPLPGSDVLPHPGVVIRLYPI